MPTVLDSITSIISWSTVFQVATRPQQHDLIDSSPLSSLEKIPGGSPLAYCNESRMTDLYQIEYIELYPNPLHMYVSIKPLLTSLLTPTPLEATMSSKYIFMVCSILFDRRVSEILMAA